MNESVFEASLRKRSINRTPDYWSSEVFQLGKRSDDDIKCTRIRIYVKEPTVEYPDPGLFIAIQGGKGSVFTRTSPEDLTRLSNFILECVDIVGGHNEDLATKSAYCWQIHQLSGAADAIDGKHNDPSQFNAINQSMQQVLDWWENQANLNKLSEPAADPPDKTTKKPEKNKST